MKDLLKRLVIAAGACLLSALCIWIVAAPVNGCAVRFFTGIPCPSCGMTRAAFSLLRLDFYGAFCCHPLIYLLLPLALFILIRYVFFGVLPTDKRYVGLYVIILTLFVVVWVIRLLFFSIP